MSGTPGALLAFRPHRGRAALLALAALAFLLLGIWMTWGEPGAGRDLGSPLVGWATILFFGVCLVMIVTQVVRGGASAVATEEGISIGRAFGGCWGPVRWAEIAHIGTGRIRGQSCLVLDLVNPDATLARLGTRPWQFAGNAGRSVWLSSLRFDRPLPEVVEALTALWEARR